MIDDACLSRKSSSEAIRGVANPRTKNASAPTHRRELSASGVRPRSGEPAAHGSPCRDRVRTIYYLESPAHLAKAAKDDRAAEVTRRLHRRFIGRRSCGTPLAEVVRDMNERSDATVIPAAPIRVASERVLWGRSHQPLTCNSVAPVSGLRRGEVGRGPRGRDDRAHGSSPELVPDV